MSCLVNVVVLSMSCPCLVLSMFSRPCCVFCVFCVICCVYQPLFVILVLIVFHMVILYFTQVNKVLARSLGMCLGEDVMVPMGYMPTAPTLPTWSLWRLHTLFQFSKPITAQSPSPCKWQPPQPLFSSALVTGWCQSHWCLPCMVPLYKRVDLPSPLLTFWLNVA